MQSMHKFHITSPLEHQDRVSYEGTTGLWNQERLCSINLLPEALLSEFWTSGITSVFLVWYEHTRHQRQHGPRTMTAGWKSTQWLCWFYIKVIVHKYNSFVYAQTNVSSLKALFLLSGNMMTSNASSKKAYAWSITECILYFKTRT